MTATLFVSEPTALVCSECGEGHFTRGPAESEARCLTCGDFVNVAHDIARHLEPGQIIVWVPDYLDFGTGETLAYFTESLEDGELT